jgi:AraC-like DNA-binding protein
MESPFVSRLMAPDNGKRRRAARLERFGHGYVSRDLSAYREFAARPELSELVACTWEREIPRSDSPQATRVLPDGCVDLVWQGRGLVIAGPDRGPVLSPPRPGQTIVGLRLRPGLAGLVLGLPASELRDARVTLDRVWGRPGAELSEQIGDADSPRRRRALLEETVLQRLARADQPDRLVLAATRSLGLPGTRVGSLAATLGASERQLRRRFDAAVGYGPKMLDRVLRFQRFLGGAGDTTNGDAGLARLAADFGYADQAHLSRECMRLSGLSPARLLATRAA